MPYYDFKDSVNHETGLASIVFAVIVLNEQLPDGGTIGLTAACTILLCIIAHGLNANLLVAKIKNFLGSSLKKPFH